MKITIETIPHADQRYPTVGDWTFDATGDLTIRVSDMGDWRKEACVAVHELIEVLICKQVGVTQADVDRFDMGHPELDEPGNDSRAPYYEQHQVASGIEQILAKELELDWNEYNAATGAL